MLIYVLLTAQYIIFGEKLIFNSIFYMLIDILIIFIVLIFTMFSDLIFVTFIVSL